MKKKVWLVQCNNLYGKDQCFLPYSVGLLQAYAQQDPVIQSEYEFAGFVFLREPIPEVVRRMEGVGVCGISVYIWNASYSLALARAVKEAYPNCLIVLGGPHVPVRSENFFRDHPYCDVLSHYEGEATFHEVLLRAAEGKADWSQVKGISFRDGLEAIKTPSRDRMSDLSMIPNPYLSGVFDSLMGMPYKWHPTTESDRGCPFSCT